MSNIASTETTAIQIDSVAMCLPGQILNNQYQRRISGLDVERPSSEPESGLWVSDPGVNFAIEEAFRFEGMRIRIRNLVYIRGRGKGKSWCGHTSS
jgi:hypothetical protein